MAKSFLNQTGLPRGLRNNSPGNIRTGDNWQGMVGSEDGFVQFSNIAWGIRAMATDIAGDMLYDKMDTIAKLINEYAPPGVDNNHTANYIAYVSQRTGFAPNQALPFTLDTLRGLMRAMMEFELRDPSTGRQYADLISDADINEGLGLLNDKLLSALKVAKSSGSLVLALLVLVVAGVAVKKTFF
jgi:hypothetical protein